MVDYAYSIQTNVLAAWADMKTGSEEGEQHGESVC